MLLAIPFGLAIGLSVGMLGGGGAVLAIPVLVYALGQDVHEATTTSLVVVAAAAIAGGLRQALDDQVCWRHAAALAIPASAGILAGTAANTAVAGSLLLALFAPVMLLAAWATWRKAGAETKEDPNAGCPPLVLRRDVSLGLAVGLLTGFFGVGGGFVVVPTLALALGFAMRNAIGTSLVIVSAISLLGAGIHLVAGNTLDAGLTTVMTLACVAGAILGGSLAPHIPQRTLGRGFAALVTLVALYLLASTAFLGGPPGN